MREIHGELRLLGLEVFLTLGSWAAGCSAETGASELCIELNVNERITL